MELDLDRPRRVHLVGIGGAGMSGIARMLLQRGHEVSGSDRQEGRAIEGLRAMGARIGIGHHEDAVGDAEVLVSSTAIAHDNPELVAARDRGLPVLHRSQMLAALMRGRHAVLVAGTHGKTTTTSMLVVALQAAGRDPSFAIGGALNETGSNAHAGTGDLFVAEADESDRSFLAYEPDLAIVTNVELDHPDAFDDLDDTSAVFRRFLAQRRPSAPVIVCRDDPGSAALRDVDPPVITYGEHPDAEVRLVVTGGEARVRVGGDEIVSFRLGIPGRHNLVNATAVVAACRELGVDLDQIAVALTTFTGTQRRFQRLGEVDGVAVVDDYAHHPTELRATLAAARSVTEGRVLLVVQPHRFSRTQRLGAELGRAAAAADLVVVTDVYGSDEEPIPGVTGELVVDAARQAGANVVWRPHRADVAEAVAAVARPGDLVLVTGAGDVNQVGPEVLDLLADPGRRT